jgi:hypothetical protein
LLYLYINQEKDEEWAKQPVNWINLGIVIYFPASLIIFILSNYIIAGSNAAMKTLIWNIHAGLVMIMYLLWAHAFRISGNER